MSVIENTEVDLGFVEKTDPWKVMSKFFPSKIGGYPAWLDLEKLPSTEEILCQMCHSPMIFLCQIYAPLDDKEDCFHRTLFMFVCPDGSCNTANDSSNIKVFRCQLPRQNTFYSFQAPKEIDDGTNGPTAADYCKLCIVCGCIGRKLCGGCRSVSYCSKNHQVADWKSGHNKDCQQSNIKIKCHATNITFPEFEIQMEAEEIEVDIKSDNERLKEFEDLSLSENITFQNNNSETNNLIAMSSEESDEQFSHFHTTINHYPDQVIRYQAGGIPLWASLENKSDDIPPCPNCKENRRFEFQVMPQLLVHMNIETTENSLDWATVIVYTCSNNCKIDGYIEEFVYKQDFCKPPQLE